MSERAPAPGGLALVEALVNTVDLATGADRLDTVEGRAVFGLAAEEAQSAKDLRESLRVVCLAHAGHPPHRTAVLPLGDLLAEAPLVVAVDTADGAATLVPSRRPTALTSRVATAIAEAVTAGTWLRLKACESPTCHWAYYDRSPAGKGRWCSMAVCGARAKMKTYRARGK
ncbi:CGNR zinc finger domain-containing protein [Streptomyces sp. NPDC091292]|uniref:CGNR zinc finger domain-containing protein n=1 Tax=Streptomyces sp. NPDC091292 TaxID=3365991 RepID=UPI00382CB69F